MNSQNHEARRIANLLERTIDGPMWHGPSVGDVLKGIDAAQAARRPISDAHTIWELVLHIRAWADIARARLAESFVPEPTDAEDWPPVTTISAAAWAADLTAMRSSYQTLARAVAALPDERLADIVAGRDQTVRTLLHGVVEHGTYHGGQIALLKKL